MIKVDALLRQFKVLNRREGLFGSFKDIWSGDYRIVTAVDNVSFSIAEGEIVGFIGPNGAGKSTTIKMLIGALIPTAGAIDVAGFHPHRDRREYVKNIGVVFGQRTQLWWDIPVIESFKVIKQIYEVDDVVFKKKLDIFAEVGGASGLLNVPVKNLSLGQRMLCDIFSAFIHNPKVVFLDEPTIGLDVGVKSKVRNMIGELNRTIKTTVILTTHDNGDLEDLAQRIIMIDSGKIKYDGDIKNFNRLFGAFRTVSVAFKDSERGFFEVNALMQKYLGESKHIVVERGMTGWVDITVNESMHSVVDVVKKITSHGNIVDLKVYDIGFEDVVKKCMGGGLK